MSLIENIDSLLKKRGSPMTGMGSFFVAAGKKYGVDPRLVVSIAGAESGFGVHIPAGTFNAWGWGPGRQLGSWQHAISTVTQGLASGYISQGLKTPEQIVKKYSPASAGNDESQWASNVNSFMHELGSPVVVTTVTPTKTTTTATAPPKTTPAALPAAVPSHDFLRQAAFQNLSDIARTGHADAQATLGSLAFGAYQDQLANAQRSQPTPTSDTPAPPLSSTTTTTPSSTPSSTPPPSAKSFSNTWLKPGGSIIGTPYSGTHRLGNWQSDNAIDISLPVGTPVYAPVAGTLGNTGYLPGVSPSDTGRFAGQRINLFGSGQGFFFQHLSSLAPGIKQGATVKAGQLLGYTGSANGSAHLHFGVEHGSPYSYYKG